MKITFIQPGMTSSKATDAMQPLSYAILSAMTPSYIDREFYDDRIEALPSNHQTDLVVMTVDTFSAKRAYSIAQEYQSRGIPVIMGGFHPTLCPREALAKATSVAIGDAELIWPTILDDWQAGLLKKQYLSGNVSGLFHTSFDRTIYERKKYVPIKPLQWGRGCPNCCDFCSINSFYGRCQKIRSIDDVVDEIEIIKEHLIFFIDDNLYHDKESLTNLLNRLIPLKIKWVCQISIDVTNDREIMSLMEKSGCIAVVVGFETLNEKNLIQMRKKCNGSNYSTAVRIFRDHGIMIYGTFVFGYDEDTPDSIKSCLDFSLKSRLFMANFNPLTPTPGTSLYNRLLKEKRMLYPEWWNDPEYRYGHALFNPRKMTADQLTDGCFKARKTFNSYRSIFNRGIDFSSNLKSISNLWIYLMGNLINRREVYKKQNMAFGV